MTLEINYREINVKNTNTWRLNNTLLNNQEITEEVKGEIKKYLETNDNENTTIQNLWDSAKAVLRGKFITIQAYLKKQEKSQGFPGGAVAENLPANAGHMGSSPGLGRSHMPQSSWAREPQLLSLRVWSLCSATTEAAIMRGPRTAMKSGPHLPQLEKALAQKRRPTTAINK